MNLRARLGDERGHTMPELLVAMVCGMIVLIGSLTALEAATRRSTEVQGRVDATQRGRLAMDTMTRSLRSQVCGPNGAAAVQAAGASSITFYADFTPEGSTAERRVLTHDPAAAVITEAIYVPGGTPAAPTYPSAPTRVRTVLTDVYAPEDSAVLQYYAYDTSSPPKAELALTAPLSAADRARSARIKLRYVTRPTGAIRPSRAQVLLESDVYTRSANPNDEAPNPTCG